MIIGIDPGVNNIGIAVLNSDASIVLDTALWSIGKPELKGYNEFVDKLYSFLYNLKLDYNTAIVSVEKPFFTPMTLPNNIRTLEVIGLIKYACFTCVREDNLVMVSPSNVKKQMTGKGNANKKAVIDAVNAKYSLTKDVSISHIADAIAIGYTAYKNKNECSI
jgi:Holliday junction resolvasome RuvABC endonuclease subunit